MLFSASRVNDVFPQKSYIQSRGKYFPAPTLHDNIFCCTSLRRRKRWLDVVDSKVIN